MEPVSNLTFLLRDISRQLVILETNLRSLGANPLLTIHARLDLGEASPFDDNEHSEDSADSGEDGTPDDSTDRRVTKSATLGSAVRQSEPAVAVSLKQSDLPAQRNSGAAVILPNSVAAVTSSTQLSPHQAAIPDVQHPTNSASSPTSESAKTVVQGQRTPTDHNGRIQLTPEMSVEIKRSTDLSGSMSMRKRADSMPTTVRNGKRPSLLNGISENSETTENGFISKLRSFWADQGVTAEQEAKMSRRGSMSPKSVSASRESLSASRESLSVKPKARSALQETKSAPARQRSNTWTSKQAGPIPKKIPVFLML